MLYLSALTCLASLLTCSFEILDFFLDKKLVLHCGLLDDKREWVRVIKKQIKGDALVSLLFLVEFLVEFFFFFFFFGNAILYLLLFTLQFFVAFDSSRLSEAEVPAGACAGGARAVHVQGAQPRLHPQCA
jgi:hypothetical protein